MYQVYPPLFIKAYDFIDAKFVQQMPLGVNYAKSNDIVFLPAGFCSFLLACINIDKANEYLNSLMYLLSDPCEVMQTRVHPKADESRIGLF